MKTTIKKTSRIITIVICEIITLCTIGSLFYVKKYSRSLLAFFTIFLIFLPEIFERLMRCSINNAVYILTVLYLIGPMLGHCCKFYHRISWWDKALHTYGGVVFALLGIFLFEQLWRGNESRLLVALFAICFSVCVSVIWEFYEFGADMLFGNDMMDDVVISEFNSYLLGDSVGEIGSASGITAVEINGSPLPVSGYIDIGLIDTMTDMLLETLGAIAVTLACCVPDKQLRFIEPKLSY
ncbi:MAG: hypothetical protein IKK70_07625 [Clostridia bacterium]|nr:hypothetical protein [Clostridia bacterium]